MSTEDKRMRDLVKLFEKKDEIFSKEKKEINEEALIGEYKRLKDIASGSNNVDFKENFSMPTDFVGDGIGQGQTVNSIVDSVYKNPAITFNAIKQPIKPEEAFEISIKRTLESGSPVNNLGFYDEINLNLNQLGFNSKNPLDIKTKILSMISNKDK